MPSPCLLPEKAISSHSSEQMIIGTVPEEVTMVSRLKIETGFHGV